MWKDLSDLASPKTTITWIFCEHLWEPTLNHYAALLTFKSEHSKTLETESGILEFTVIPQDTGSLSAPYPMESLSPKFKSRSAHRNTKAFKDIKDQNSIFCFLKGNLPFKIRIMASVEINLQGKCQTITLMASLSLIS